MKKVDLNLYRAGVVADLSFSCWGARAKLEEEDVGLEGVSELIILGGKKLVPKEKMEKVYAPISEARGFLYKNSFEFPFGNSRFIPYSILKKITDKMDACGKEFWEGVEEFLSGYEVTRKEMLEEYDKVFEDILKQRKMNSNDIPAEKKKLLDLLAKKYPSVSVLRKKFGFEFILFEVDSPDFKTISSEKALDNVAISKAAEQAYKERVEEKMDKFLEEVVSRLKAMVLDTVDKLKGKIEKESLSQATVKSFKRFTDSFKGMDFVDTNIDQAISVLEMKLSAATKSDLSDGKFQEVLSKELDGIKEMADSIDTDKILGRFKRGLRVIE